MDVTSSSSSSSSSGSGSGSSSSISSISSAIVTSALLVYVVLCTSLRSVLSVLLSSIV